MALKEIINSKEYECLDSGLVFPELSKKILSKIELRISEKDLLNLNNHIKNRYGILINLNENYHLKLQYHGRFNSFLIGIGVNPSNPSQPKIKLLRLETTLEESHKNNQMIFIGEENITAFHIHWYFGFVRMIEDKEIINLKKSIKMNYKIIIQNILNKNPDLDNQILNGAIPFEIFEKIYILKNKHNKQIREDCFITANNSLRIDSTRIIDKIIKKRVF